MNYSEFVVFELALDGFPFFAGLAGPQEYFESQWNKPHHGLSRAEMLDLLDRLAIDGDILTLAKDQTTFQPTREQIKAWLVSKDRNDRGHYRLTTQGGERWEQFAKPNWDRFHSYEWDWDNDGFLEIAASSPEAAERAFFYAVKWNNMRVFPETVERRIHHPWKATYWKELPVGYGVRFKCEHEGKDGYVEGLDKYGSWLFDPETREYVFDALIHETHKFIRSEYEYFHNWYAKHPETQKMGPS